MKTSDAAIDKKRDEGITTRIPSEDRTDAHHRIVIVGGGTAGITVAARLKRAIKGVDMAIIEPSSKHYYQPLWTLVGAGVYPKEITEREEADYIPKGAVWMKDAVTSIDPERNTVKTRDGRVIGYDYLIVAPGIQIDWDRVKGLKESIGHGGVCSNYAYDHVDSTWEAIRNFRGGNALFTAPATAIKCGGAPQKIMYLADAYFRKSGVRDKARVMFVSAGTTIFGVAKYKPVLSQLVERRGIETQFRHNLVEIRSDSKEAVFERMDTGETVTIPYEMLHVTPPMSAPDFIKHSPLANEAGWVDVDRDTLQHRRYPNVFGLGDAGSTPNGKTGAAVRKQAPVVVGNLLAVMEGRAPTRKYNGYTSCPIVTDYGKLVLAEFDYDNNPQETFPFNQAKERRTMYWLKKYILPFMYWNGMLRGRA
jgi:sulfide:quinone oxidoreductase